jgi:ankyrin repeat protein
VLAFDFNVKGIPKLNPGWRWENQEEAVMSACSSLAMIVKDGDSRVVQFSHFSVKEYLTANRLAEPIRDVSHYYIRLEAAHTILAQACLGVLLRLDDQVDRDNIDNFPLARYAAQYWATHARFENASSWFKDGMECLFDADKPHFSTWLWIYNEGLHLGSMTTLRPDNPGVVPLYYAARLGFRDLAENLSAKHPEYVNAWGGYEETPLHAAARGGHADILSLLLERGADMGAQWEGIGITPLHRASSYGKVEAVRFLLDHGAVRADINANGGHWTALHCAVSSRNIQVVRLLLEHGADVNVRDANGQTPSQLSTGQDVVELLSGYGDKSVK